MTVGIVAPVTAPRLADSAEPLDVREMADTLRQESSIRTAALHFSFVISRSLDHGPFDDDDPWSEDFLHALTQLTDPANVERFYREILAEDDKRLAAEAKRAAIRSHGLRRRARKLNAPGSCSADQLEARWDFYRSRCWLCDAPATTVDHVKPLAKGGSNWPANLRPACRSCNSRKHARWPFPVLEAKLEAMRARRLRKVTA